MTDPDIRRLLQLQTKSRIDSISLDAVRVGVSALANALGREHDAGRPLVVTDTVDDDDLRQIGEAISGHRFVTGGYSIKIGLPQNFRDRPVPEPAARGRGVALCSSCAQTLRAQVARHLDKHPGLSIEPYALMSGSMTAAEAAGWVLAQGVRRIVGGGGETSGAVVEALGIQSLEIGQEIDPACRPWAPGAAVRWISCSKR